MIVFSENNLDTTDGPSTSKKLKSGDSDSDIKKQNKLIFKYRDYFKTLSIKVCKELLEYNKQEIPSSDNAAVCKYIYLIDIILFILILYIVLKLRI